MAEDAIRFRGWLDRQQGRDDDVGAFARRALADPMTRGFGTLIGYWITWAGGDEELEGSACIAIREYEAALPKRRVLPP